MMAILIELNAPEIASPVKNFGTGDHHCNDGKTVTVSRLIESHGAELETHRDVTSLSATASFAFHAVNSAMRPPTNVSKHQRAGLGNTRTPDAI